MKAHLGPITRFHGARSWWAMMSPFPSGSLGGDQDLPARTCWCHETGHRVVEVTDQPGSARQTVTGTEQAEPVRPRHGSLDEAEDLPPMLVNAQRPGRALEADCPQIRQQCVHRGRVRPSRPAHRVTHAHHTGTHIPAAKRLLRVPLLIHTTQSAKLPGSRAGGSGSVGGTGGLVRCRPGQVPCGGGPRGVGGPSAVR